MHVAKRLIYALAISIVPFEMTFTRYFSSMHYKNIISTIPIHREQSRKTYTYDNPTNLSLEKNQE